MKETELLIIDKLAALYSRVDRLEKDHALNDEETIDNLDNSSWSLYETLDQKILNLTYRIEEIEDVLNKIDLIKLPDAIFDLETKIENIEHEVNQFNAHSPDATLELSQQKEIYGDELVELILALSKRVFLQNTIKERLQDTQKILKLQNEILFLKKHLKDKENQ